MSKPISYLLCMALGAGLAFGYAYVDRLDQRVHNIENFLAVISAGR